MKRKDFLSLREKKLEDLKKLVVTKKMEASKLRVNFLSGKEKNVKSVNNLKREIAKILTLVREKEILAKLEKVSKKESEK